MRERAFREVEPAFRERGRDARSTAAGPAVILQPSSSGTFRPKRLGMPGRRELPLRTRLPILCLLAGLCAAALAAAPTLPAAAVIIASGDGSGNTTPPPDDPGFDHVAVLNGLSGVYLGGGWMLTAFHVGVQDAAFASGTHRAVPGSGVQLETAGSGTDLRLFRLETDPGLPGVPVASGPPSGGLVMAGNGRHRGAATSWDPGAGPAIDGFAYGPGRTRRWGTNEPAGFQTITISGRQIVAFYTAFDENAATEHEAQAAPGDSGGAVFAETAGGWELAGIMVAVGTFGGQPAQTALFGNTTWAADLSAYRDQILPVIAVPACSDGVDDDGDGLVDGDDPGCADPEDAFERSDLLPCDDGSDDDGDGAHDFPADPGCATPQSPTEAPACSDGVDNDGDGKIDFDGGAWAHGGTPLGEPDPFCSGPTGPREGKAGCGLGFGLAPLLVLWAVRRRFVSRSR